MSRPQLSGWVSARHALRRAYRLAPRRVFSGFAGALSAGGAAGAGAVPAYSRIIESLPFADVYIDLRGCELNFASPVDLGDGSVRNWPGWDWYP